jgi:enoyl-CoA hydratase
MERSGIRTDKMVARKDGGIGTIIFNNPAKHNAVSLEMWLALIEILEEFARDDAVRVIVVRGAGGRAFVSGADISKFEDERAEQEAVDRYNEISERAYLALFESPKPTIAMIEGYCIGGGVGLAVCCDLRICTEDAKFAVPAARLGLGYGLSRLQRLINIVGPAFTKEICFTARQFTAEEASAMGLVNRVVGRDRIEAYVRDCATKIAENAPLTVKAIKRITAEAMKDPGRRDEALCDRLVAECFASEDYVEGRRAFLEKRKPSFKGR